MSGQTTRAPIINAPLPLTAFALTLIGLHALRVFAPEAWQNIAFYHGALFPERFWAYAEGSSYTASGLAPYGGFLGAIAPLFLSALLHGDWFHVLLNAAFLVAIGKPVLDMISSIHGRYDTFAVITFLVLTFISQAGGGLVYLVLNNPAGPIAVGASGGLSGLLGAFLLMRDGGSARLFSRAFLTVSAIFIVANYLFALIGPSLLGASIAWEVHVGGYVAGALFARVLIWNALRRMGN